MNNNWNVKIELSKFSGRGKVKRETGKGYFVLAEMYFLVIKYGEHNFI